MTTFIRAETGAVTVDWVVLTAALVGLGLATMAVVSSGVENVSGDIDSELKRDDIIRTSFETPVDFSYRDHTFGYYGNHPGTAHPDYDFQTEIDGRYDVMMGMTDDELMRHQRDRDDQTNFLNGMPRSQAEDESYLAAHEMERRGLDPLPSCWPPVNLHESCT